MRKKKKAREGVFFLIGAENFLRFADNFWLVAQKSEESNPKIIWEIFSVLDCLKKIFF